MRWFLLFCLLLAGFARAYDDKVCYPSSGVPTQHTFSLTKTLTKEENIANTTIVPRTSTTSSGSTYYSCDCTSPNAMVNHWWSSQAMFSYTTDSKGHWQQITPNMEANVEMYVWKSTGGETTATYHSVPFTSVTNNTSQKCGMVNQAAATGQSGTVSIRVTKPSVGTVSFKGVVGKVWHYRKANYLNTADPVEVMISLDLQIVIPGGCTLLPGSVLNVDLGNKVKQNQFKDSPYPAAPASYTPVPFALKFDCDFSGGDMGISLNGDTDSQGQGFATSKKDVSVIVADSDGNVLPPNTLAGTVTVNEDGSTSTLTLNAWPAHSGSDATPTAGKYDATATILLSYR